MSSYWAEADDGSYAEFVDAAPFADLDDLDGEACNDHLVDDAGFSHSCARDPGHPGRHASINFREDGDWPAGIVLAAWPGAHRPDAADAEVMPS